jgi:protein phosphatase
MGTTCTAAYVTQDEVVLAHVGDSRCYLVREGQIFLMTEDHSQVMELVRRGELAREEARTHPDRNVISQALGGKRAVQVSTWPAPLATRAGDRFLLCSDGLTDVVGDAELLAVVSALPPQGACERLVALARAAGAPDNVTVAILGVGSAAVPEPAPRETRQIKLAG